MSLVRIDLGLLLALTALAAGGAVVLSSPACTQLDARDLEYFQTRHYWQCAFDGLSAACGAGLLTYDFGESYTETGRWVLTAIGLVGALLYVVVFARVLARMQGEEARRLQPHPLAILGIFLGMMVLMLGAYGVFAWLRGIDTNAGAVVRQAISAFASLGFVDAPQDSRTAPGIAVMAWTGALGCLVWFSILPRLRVGLNVRATLILAASYSIPLLGAAGALWLFEMPRAGSELPGRVEAATRPALRDSGSATRFGRALVQVTSAAGAGIATESLVDRDVSEGAKVTLAMLLLIGGLPGSAAGGMTWVLVISAIFGAATILRQRSAKAGHRNEVFERWCKAGLACFLWISALVMVVALGLLMIENMTGSRFQAAPSFADALLDAASAVAGGNLSSGVTATVTDRNLTSGIRLGVNQYQIGMTWLMLAMIVGRVLPVWVLCRAAVASLTRR